MDVGSEVESRAEMIRTINLTVNEVSGETPLEGVLLGVVEPLQDLDWGDAFGGCKVIRTPSWESAFRRLREGTAAGLLSEKE